MYSVDESVEGLLGYQLHTYGGNFVRIQKFRDCTKITWSFYQDFPLFQDLDQGILLSNDPFLQGQLVKPDNIGLTIQEKSIFWTSMPWQSWLTSHQSSQSVLDKLLQHLNANLSACLNISSRPHKIVFTGGLDSGLLAFMALHQQYQFDCVVNTYHKDIWKELPFSNICYRDSSVRSDIWGPDKGICESYYDPDMSDCITGFFGDTAMVHNKTLYYQCSALGRPEVEIYDREDPGSVPMFTNQFQAKKAVINILRSTRYRQWFSDFRILDPYRDPNITQLILSLPWPELCSQFGNAWVQRQIIKTFDPSWCDLLLKHKNEYPSL
jgi:hypothetical protein